ncbi:hypothetical protein MLD38_016322 [Melastoma candidum]|uniref:Uncharacterized protein n=1 Tax=Melastoma candidum TaxID=119954 RepID=A0ACB9RN95_9MYRT|nr:hypothetical protein MLD38_016322 [Melastoma candidum]
MSLLHMIVRQFFIIRITLDGCNRRPFQLLGGEQCTALPPDTDPFLGSGSELSPNTSLGCVQTSNGPLRPEDFLFPLVENNWSPKLHSFAGESGKSLEAQQPNGRSANEPGILTSLQTLGKGWADKRPSNMSRMIALMAAHILLLRRYRWFIPAVNSYFPGWHS